MGFSWKFIKCDSMYISKGVIRKRQPTLSNLLKCVGHVIHFNGQRLISCFGHMQSFVKLTVSQNVYRKDSYLFSEPLDFMNLTGKKFQWFPLLNFPMSTVFPLNFNVPL